MIVAHAVPGEEVVRGTGHHRQNHILRMMHTVAIAAPAVDAATETAPPHRVAPDPAPLWRVVVRTVMEEGTATHAPAVPVSLKGVDMVGQHLLLMLWILELVGG